MCIYVQIAQHFLYQCCCRYSLGKVCAEFDLLRLNLLVRGQIEFQTLERIVDVSEIRMSVLIRTTVET